MKKKISIIACTILLGFVLLFILGGRANAASTNFSASDNTVEVGDTIKVTAEVTATQWDLNITVNGSQIASSSELDNYKSNITESFSGTYKATKEGTVTFELSGDITDFNQTNSNVNKSITVTVKAKSSTGSSSGSGSSSSGSGSSSSGNSSSGTQTTAPNFSSVNETVYATSSGVNVRSSYSTSSSAIGSLQEGQKLTRTGIATRAVNGITWSRVEFNGQTAYVSSAYLTKEEPEQEKSSNNDLKSLTIEGYTINPEFSSDVTEYNLNVGQDIETLSIDAVAEDENAKVEITGNGNLVIGQNTVEIKVTAEDETVKTYTINVNRGEELPAVHLTELTVEGYTLTPEFSSDVYEYTLNINNVNVKSLNINAQSNDENATVEIAGNTDLKLGENVITILVQSENNEVATYQIIVNIEEEVVVEEQIIAGIDNNDLFLYGGIALAALVIIIIIIVVSVKRNHKNDDEFEMYNAGFSSFDTNKDDKDVKETLVNDKVDANQKQQLDTQDDVKKEKKKDRKSLIDENFGDSVNNTEFEEDRTKRKRGKHF